MTNKMVMTLAVLTIFLFPTFSWSHPLDMAYLQIVVGDNNALKVTVDVHPFVAKRLVGNADVSAQNLFASIFDTGSIRFSGPPCTFTAPKLTVLETIATLEALGECGGGSDSMQISMPFVKALGGGYQLLGRAQKNGHEQFYRMTADATEVTLKIGAAPEFFELVLMGIQHIGAWPSEWRSDLGGFKIAGGIDHILFVIALILGATSLRGIILTAGGFTIGHSITLALALFHVVTVPSWLVESLIALSISIVAVESLFKSVSLRVKVFTASFFGLIHGLGFAAALSILNISDVTNTLLSLVGFNTGIEIGQLIIILLIGPLVFWAGRTRLFGAWMKPAIAAVIFLCGIVWFFKRI